MLQSEVIDITIADISDVTQSVFLTRNMLERKGFAISDQYTIGTVVSELATNISRYAGRGMIVVKVSLWRRNARVEIEASDRGPGIENIEKAFEEYHSSGDSLGLGLAMVKRLMDEVTVETGSIVGTRIRAVKVYPLGDVP